MSPKDYLMRVVRAEREIKTLKLRMQHFEAIGLSMASFSSGNASVKPSTPSSRVETAAIGIVDTLQALDANLRAYTAIVRDAEKLIRQVPTENYRRILTMRYLCDMSFRSISDEMKYTDRNSVYRAHGWALLEFGKVLRMAKLAGEVREDG